MKETSCTQKTVVIKNPSKAVVELVNKLRDRKMNQLEELSAKKEFYFPAKK